MFNRKAQSTAEYAIIIGVVVGAIMAVGVFLRGGIEAKVRHATNEYLKAGNLATNFATPVLRSDYETGSNSQTEAQEVTGTSKSKIIVGGGSEGEAEDKGVTKRKGETRFFEPEQ